MNAKKTVLVIVIFTAITAMNILPYAYAANWQTVTTITGSTDQTTATFNIPAQEWRLQWSYTPDPQYPQYSALYIYVYPQGETAAYIDEVHASGNAQTSSTEYIYQGSGSFYLKILDANIPSYTITIQQDTSSTTPTPTPSKTPAATTKPSDSSLAYIISAALIIGVVIAAVIIANWQARRHRPQPQISPPPPPPPPSSMKV
jgi:hypothetical protein